MRITQEADYALRIIFRLAEEGSMLGARAIADATNVTPRFALKILRKLSIGGLVKSYQGARGGFALAAEPADISMLGVIEIIDGPMAISKCIGHGGECTANGDKAECVFHNIFNAVNDNVAKSLSRVSIADIIENRGDVDRIVKMIINDPSIT